LHKATRRVLEKDSRFISRCEDSERWGIQKPFVGGFRRGAQAGDHGHFRSQKKTVAIVSPVPTKGTKRPLGLLPGKARIAIADNWEINESQFLGT
jgi:hypothetical protein